jgi:DNA-directed RNA polymerase subunit RPC12/RpoP
MEVKSKMTRLERAIKVCYNEVLSKRASLMGKHVRIGDVVHTIKEIYSEEFTNEEINNTLLRLFYNDHKIDLSPGKSNYFIEDNNGNRFGYMLWREDREIETEEQENENETQWFRCMNCWTEFILGDLGLFITSEDNKLAYFCPVCGFWEFCTSEEAPHDEEIQDILEDGPDHVYEYPGKIIRDVKDEYYLREHEDLLEIYKKKREQELQKKTEDFKHLFDNS